MEPSESANISSPLGEQRRLWHGPALARARQGIVRSFWLCWITYRRFCEHRGHGLAAAIAFFSLLSFGPFLIFVGVIFRTLVGRQDFAVARIEQSIAQVIPIGTERLTELLDSFVASMTAPVGTIGFIILVWTASSAFNLVYLSIRTAGDLATKFVPQRLMGLGSVIVLGGVLLLAFFFASTFHLVDIITVPEVDGPLLNGALEVGRVLAHGLGVGLFLVILYKVCVGRSLSFKSTLISAAVFGPAWELSKRGFWAGALTTVQEQSIYGALTTSIIVLFWVYYSACFVVLGAEWAFVLDLARSGRLQAAVERLDGVPYRVDIMEIDDEDEVTEDGAQTERTGRGGSGDGVDAAVGHSALSQESGGGAIGNPVAGEMKESAGLVDRGG